MSRARLSRVGVGGVAVLVASGLLTGRADADDLGQVGRIAQVTDPAVPGLGNVAQMLDGPPAQQRTPERMPQEPRAHEMSQDGAAEPSDDPADGPVNTDGAPGTPAGPAAPDAPGPAGPDASDPAGPPGQQAPAGPAAPDRAQLEGQLLAATNQARTSSGCPALMPDWHLATSAQQHADDMAAHSYFSHSSLDGRTFDRRIRDTGYSGSAVGENIASGFNSAPEVENAWMDSPAHRRNILDCGFHSVGIGYDQQGGYWTVDFGS